MVVTLYQGNVVVMDDGGEVMLDAGERALLRPGQAPETGDRESLVVLREENAGGDLLLVRAMVNVCGANMASHCRRPCGPQQLFCPAPSADPPRRP